MDAISARHSLQRKQTLEIIESGKKITPDIVKNVILFCEADKKEVGSEVNAFRKKLHDKMNIRADMVDMFMFLNWRNAYNVLTCDMDNPFFDNISDVSTFISFPYGMYIGDIKDGKENGVGRIVHRDNWDFYTGEWKDGLRHGKGKLVRFLKNYIDIYEGDWNCGKREGNGRSFIVSDNVSKIYTGQWKDNTIYGYGKIVFHYNDANSDRNPIGEIYEGDWINCVYHGKGKLIDEEGCVFTGDFKDGKKHGNGTITYTDGTVICGTWKHGRQCNSNEDDEDDEDDEEDVEDFSDSENELCPTCNTETTHLDKAKPNPKVSCGSCSKEFSSIYVIIPCGHFICSDCSDTYLKHTYWVPDPSAFTL